jgi:hypothetical protein
MYTDFSTGEKFLKNGAKIRGAKTGPSDHKKIENRFA